MGFNIQHTIGIVLILAFVMAIYYLTRHSVTKDTDCAPLIPDGTGKKGAHYIQRHPKKHSIEKRIIPPAIKPNFLNIRFNTDYRDVQTAFNNMVPSSKQIFNIANQPLKYSQPDVEEVEGIVVQFVEELNKQTAQVPEARNKNTGWDEAVADANIESGWEAQRKELGLEPSLYPKPLGRSIVDLIAIETVQKYSTEEEVKYTVRIILQKGGSEEQMLVKLSFVLLIDSVHDENKMFKKGGEESSVVIEEIFIEGFLSDHGTDAEKQYEMTNDKLAEFQKFDDSEFQNMTDPKDIMRQLEKEYNKRLHEMEMRNSILDPDARDMHLNKIDLGRTNSFQVTRSIEDDLMARNRIFS